jgi:glycine cleavage system regulatory protein
VTLGASRPRLAESRWPALSDLGLKQTFGPAKAAVAVPIVGRSDNLPRGILNVMDSEMNTPLVLTFIGDDRPGVVNAISEKVAACGGTWLESRLAHLAGEFAGILMIGISEERIGDLTAALRILEATGLRIAVKRSAPAAVKREGKTLVLNLVGHERPGIVRDVTQALTNLGVNIEEFSSGIESAPFTGGELFRAKVRLHVPDNIASEHVQKTIEQLAAEIMVDLTVSEGATETQ